MPNLARPITSGIPEEEIGCRIEAPEPYRAQAWFALENLLRPLNLKPTEGRGGIWYGESPPTEEGWLHFRLDPATPGSITSSRREAPVQWVSGESGRVPYLFPGGLHDGGDPIASSFYWLAGCDELAHPASDRFGRPVGQTSLLSRLGVLENPPVDGYRTQLAEHLRRHGVQVRTRRWGNAKWVLCPTFDIDYLRKWRKGILYREFFEYLVAGRGPGPRVGRALSGLRQWLGAGDPYRTSLSRLAETLASHAGQGTFFFKAGAHGPHDVPYSLKTGFARRTLTKLREVGHEIGLHPSFHAYNHPGFLRRERERLIAAAGAPVEAVRTHYLRFDPLNTARFFQECGFRIDSTLGFPDVPGFRNGTCLPFRVWDHVKGCDSGIWEVPLVAMDSTLFNRMGLQEGDACVKLEGLMATARRYGGVVVALWHNVLWDEPDFAGWGRHYERTLETAKEEGAEILTLSGAISSWLAN